MGRVIMPGDPPLKMPEVYDEDCQWDSMHLKACALYEKSRYSEAEELFRQEYEGRRADSFPSWEKRYKCVNKLARTLGAQRKYDEALELFRQDNRPLTRKEGRHVGNRIPGEQHIDLLSLRHPLTCPLNNDGDFPNWVPGIEFSIDAYVSAAKNCVECRIYVAAVNTIHRGWISSTKKDKRNMSQYLQIYDSRILPGSQGYILLRPIYKGEKNVDVGIIEIRYGTCQPRSTPCLP